MPGQASRGLLQIDRRQFPCALGRGGIKALKREGDGATPRGSFALVRVLYRPDKICRPRSRLPVDRIRPRDGWCDDPIDRNYNRLVRHPYPASAERLWREDSLYDLVVVLSHNQRPRQRNLGSAVFMHVARPGFAPTEGCVALRREHLLQLIAASGRNARMRVAR